MGRGKGKYIIDFRIRMEKETMENLVRLKVVKGAGGSLNKFINGILVREIVDNDILLKGYEVDYSEFE